MLLEYIQEQKQDAVIWKAGYLLDCAGFDPVNEANAIGEIALMLQCIPNATLRETYAKAITKSYKVNAKLLKNELSVMATQVKERLVIEASEGSSWRFPKGIDVEKALNYGFYQLTDTRKMTGIYFQKTQNTWVKLSNFVFEPMMHVESMDDDKRMIRVSNSVYTHIIDMPSTTMISSDQFRATMFRLKGNFVWSGGQTDLLKLLEAIGFEFETCIEFKKLGWQTDGFFAYSNGIVTNSTFILNDERGIAEFNDEKYYSPSSSAIYKNAREGDDPYENDRYLLYKEPTVNFSEWAKLFCQVYTESYSGWIGVASVFMALNQDVVYKIDHNCPHINPYGEKGSGKSKYAESLSNVFMNGLLPCNLFHSTDFAFANRLSRYRNVIMWFDEFNDMTIKEERFEQIKAAYEGVARERGKGTNKNKTEILKVLCVLMLSGQYLSTKDDNSATTRCIIIPFKKRTDDTAFTQEEITFYERLKNLESNGLSGMLPEILKYRKDFEKEYIKAFPEQFSELRVQVAKRISNYNERVMRNYCALLTCINFYKDKFKLPFTYEEFKEIMINEVVRLSTQIAESDTLAEFWNTIQYLLEIGEISEGNHFKIETLLSVPTEQKVHNFGETAEKVLFLRLTTIHKLYLEACRRQGTKGINESTLKLYLSSAKGYLGKNLASRFKDDNGGSMVTVSYVFQLQHLKVSLDRMMEEEEMVLTTVSGKLHNDCLLQDIKGKPHLVYTILVDDSYQLLGETVKKHSYYKCYDPNLENKVLVNSNHLMKITGNLKIKKGKDQVEYKTFDPVSDCKIVPVGPEGDIPF